MKQRCKGVTAKNKRYSRKTDNELCWQHAPTPAVEPWQSHNLPKPHAQLSKPQKGRLNTRIKRGPTKKDEEGWIYIFSLPSDGTLTYYKIGRTTQTVEQRLRQWKKEIKEKVELVAKWRAKDHKYCESLIHIYLDLWRVYRYQTKKGLCSIWKDSGEPVTSRDKKLKNKYKLEGRKKHVEWFLGELIYFEKIVTGVCAKK